MIITVFIAIAVSGQGIAWSNSDWGNTDWRNTDWNFSDWGNTDWGNNDWGNTDFGNNVLDQTQLEKVTLGIKNPDGSCAVVVTWAKSTGEAINAVAKSCQGCIIKSLANSDISGAENAGRFCQ